MGVIMHWRLLRLTGALFAILELSSVLLSQNTAQLRGQVIDEQGALISGAHATLIDAAGKKRSAVANANGEFTIPNLAPGPYTLTIEFKGFETHLEENLQIPTAAPLKITMTIAPLKAETEVNAESSGISVEPDQNLNAIILDEKMIMDLLPDNEDDLLALLKSVAGLGEGGVDG